MLLIYSNTQIPQPSLPGSGWAANQFPILHVALDGGQFLQPRSAFQVTYTVLACDEGALGNQSWALDLLATYRLGDVWGLSKYYLDGSGNLWARGSWRPARAGQYTPSADAQVAIARSAERTAFETNLAAEVANLTAIVNAGTPANDVVLARCLLKVMRLLNRLLHPDS